MEDTKVSPLLPPSIHIIIPNAPLRLLHLRLVLPKAVIDAKIDAAEVFADGILLLKTMIPILPIK